MQFIVDKLMFFLIISKIKFVTLQQTLTTVKTL